ncbi:hypothetical protein ABPG74_014903 [Tetrahymena malaccensis]
MSKEQLNSFFWRLASIETMISKNTIVTIVQKLKRNASKERKQKYDSDIFKNIKKQKQNKIISFVNTAQSLVQQRENQKLRHRDLLQIDFQRVNDYVRVVCCSDEVTLQTNFQTKKIFKLKSNKKSFPYYNFPFKVHAWMLREDPHGKEQPKLIYLQLIQIQLNAFKSQNNIYYLISRKGMVIKIEGSVQK